jgi:hypothetical protein
MIAAVLIRQRRTEMIAAVLIQIDAQRHSPASIAVAVPVGIVVRRRSPAAPVGQQEEPARRRVSYEGTPRRARVPPVDYRDGLSGA